MQQVMVYNLSRVEIAPVTARYCDSFLCRLRGLSFRRALPPDQGLLLVERRDSRVDAAIHMLGVFFDLAVVWIHSSGEVVDVRLARRWAPAYAPQRPARFILELAAARLNDFKIGEQVRFEEVV